MNVSEASEVLTDTERLPRRRETQRSPLSYSQWKMEEVTWQMQGWGWGGGVWPLTLTGPIRPSQDGALLHLAKGLKEAPHVVLTLLLAQHPHKQLPVF